MGQAAKATTTTCLGSGHATLLVLTPRAERAANGWPNRAGGAEEGSKPGRGDRPAQASELKTTTKKQRKGTGQGIGVGAGLLLESTPGRIWQPKPQVAAAVVAFGVERELQVGRDVLFQPSTEAICPSSLIYRSLQVAAC